MKILLDMTAMPMIAAETGIGIKESLRTVLKAAEAGADGVVLFYNDGIKIVADDSAFLPMRELLPCPFFLMLQPRGDVKGVIYTLKPDYVIWCGGKMPEATHQQGAMGAMQVYLEREKEEIKRCHASAQEIARGQLALIEPESSQIKNCHKFGMDGAVFKFAQSGSEISLDDAAGYCDKLKLFKAIITPSGSAREAAAVSQSTDAIILACDVWLKLIGKDFESFLDLVE